MQLNQINQLVQNNNKNVHDELTILDSQYDGSQYFAKVTEPYYNETSFFISMQDFSDYFPDVDKNEFSQKRIRFRFSLKLDYSIGYETEDKSKFIFNNDSKLNNVKLVKINEIKCDDITTDQLLNFIEDGSDAFYDMIKDEFVNDYINNYNNFSTQQ